MSEQLYERIKQDPNYIQLSQTRSKFAYLLSIIILVVYYGFVLVVGFAPEFLAQPLSEGSTLTVGVPIGATILVFAWVMTGIYVRRANKEFDTINEKILEDAGK
ncbi:MAG: DUF485 domain-containing protein [Chromatiales bacterium]|nr:DUF485 domain-containing protein [Chromatiales bacterium]